MLTVKLHDLNRRGQSPASPDNFEARCAGSSCQIARRTGRGHRRVASGEWRVASGEWRSVSRTSAPSRGPLRTTVLHDNRVAFCVLNGHPPGLCRLLGPRGQL